MQLYDGLNIQDITFQNLSYNILICINQFNLVAKNKRIRRGVLFKNLFKMPNMK